MTPLRGHPVIVGMALGILAVGLLASACGTKAQGAAHAVYRPRPVSALNAVITIDPHVGEIFAPAPANEHPALTARQAWGRYTVADNGYGRNAPIPANVTVDIGLLTLPIGPSGPNGSEIYTVHNQLVYGYSWHQCPASRNPKVKKLPPNPCIEWLFLNANTGYQIDETFQF